MSQSRMTQTLSYGLLRRLNQKPSDDRIARVVHQRRTLPFPGNRYPFDLKERGQPVTTASSTPPTFVDVGCSRPEVKPRDYTVKVF